MADLTKDQLKAKLDAANAKIAEIQSDKDSEDGLSEIVDDSLNTEGQDNVLESVDMVILKSNYKGLLYCQPLDSKVSKVRANYTGKGISLQLGFNEAKLTDWMQQRDALLKNGVVEIGRIEGPKDSWKYKGFEDFDPDAQKVIVRNCNDTPALKRWKNLNGIEPSVSLAIVDRMANIRDWEPGK